MPVQQETFQRASDGVVAGICSSCAQRWGVDTGVLRFAVIALTLATGGMFALVYVALWLVLPVEGVTRHTVDVRPDFVASDMYGTRMREQDASKKEKASVDYAHMPPQSPDAAAAAMRAKAAAQDRKAKQSSIVPVVIGVIVGVLLIVAIMSFLFSRVAPMFSPEQFWPLAIVAIGIVAMVVPLGGAYRLEHFMIGLFVFCLGVVLLAGTTGVFFIHVGVWFAQGWPLLAMAAGFLLIWRGTYLNGFALCVMVLLVVFCMVGIAFCSDAGPSLSFITQQPFTKDLPLLGVQ